MKKKLSIVSLSLLGLLLTSCGNNPTIKYDGKMHDLADEVMIETDEMGMLYNYSVKERNLEFIIEDEAEKEYWMEEESSVKIRYQYLEDKKAPNLFKITAYVYDAYDQYNPVLKEVQKTVFEQISEWSDTIEYSLSSTSKLPKDYEEKDYDCYLLAGGYGDIEVGKHPDDEAEYDFVPLVDLHLVEEEEIYTHKKGVSTINGKTNRFAFKDGEYYVYGDEDIDITDFSRIFVKDGDGRFVEVEFDAREDDYESLKTTYIDSASKKLVGESTKIVPTAYLVF